MQKYIKHYRKYTWHKKNRKNFIEVYFFIYFFFIWVLLPFQEYFTYIEPIIHQRWAKTGEPGGKNTWPSLSRTWLSHVTRARLEPQRWET